MRRAPPRPASALKVADGFSCREQIAQNCERQGPGGPAGGMGGITPATEGWIVVNLLPGNYVAACLVVDPVSHLPHAANGMLAGFTGPT